jgi:hypothetical protein
MTYEYKDAVLDTLKNNPEESDISKILDLALNVSNMKTGKNIKLSVAMKMTGKGIIEDYLKNNIQIKKTKKTHQDLEDIDEEINGKKPFKNDSGRKRLKILDSDDSENDTDSESDSDKEKFNFDEFDKITQAEKEKVLNLSDSKKRNILNTSKILLNISMI